MESKNWNWQQDDWPDFSYNKKKLGPIENEYTKESGIFLGVMRQDEPNLHFNNVRS